MNDFRITVVDDTGVHLHLMLQCSVGPNSSLAHLEQDFDAYVQILVREEIHTLWNRTSVVSLSDSTIDHWGLTVVVSNANNAVSSDESHRMHLPDLEYSAIAALLEEIHQSNAEVTVEDLEINLHFHRGGGSRGFRNESEVPFELQRTVGVNRTNGKPRRTWFRQFYNNQEVHCAAVIVAYITTPQPRHFPNNPLALPNETLARAVEIATEKRWKAGCNVNYTTLLDTLQPFLERTREGIRVCVIPPHKTTKANPGFWSRQSVSYNPNSRGNKLFYIYCYNNHYGLINSPENLPEEERKWCKQCLNFFRDSKCPCKSSDKKPKQTSQPTTKVQCSCPDSYKTKKATWGWRHNHRCLVYTDPEKPFRTFSPYHANDQTPNDKFLFAYDVESMIVPVDDVQVDYFVTRNHDFTFENNEIVSERRSIHRHVINAITAKDVLSDFHVVFEGEDAVDNFILWVYTNKGEMYMYAHNAGRYDVPLLMETILKLDRGGFTGGARELTARGNRIMGVTTKNHIHFYDSLNHLPGSLAKLAKDFKVKGANGEELTKGFFPHLFNTPENQNYVGPIPSLEYFDLTFSARSLNEIEELKEWHSSFEGEYNFKEQLLFYNYQDVYILAEIMKMFHEILSNDYESPFFQMTSPGYAHKRVIYEASKAIDAYPKGEDDDAIQRYLSANIPNHWTILNPIEYYQARAALQGGRTDVRKIYHKLTPEDEAAGRKIVAVDVVSLYPSVQVLEDYPVGPPKITVYDEDYYPCVIHTTPEKGNDLKTMRSECDCSLYQKASRARRQNLDISIKPPETFDLTETFGFVHCTVVCPRDLYHPVLGTNHNNKLVYPTGTVTGTWTTPELLRAVECGYEIKTLYFSQHYKQAPGLWNPFIFSMFVEKARNSKPPNNPTTAYQEYANKFPDETGFLTRMQEALLNASLNPAARQVYKIMLNSLWGKHCQRPNLPSTTVFPNIIDDPAVNDNYLAKMNQIARYNEKLLKHECFERHYVVTTTNNTRRTPPHLSQGYLPAAIFVPAYGRLVLHKYLHPLGKRVLYHDTDSIYYIYDPALYNAPTSTALGGLEEETISKDGIIEFVAPAPKSYSILTRTGETLTKAKGISSKYAHRNIVNFKVMKDMVQGHLNSILVPQMTFIKKGIGHSTFTKHFLKLLKFDPTQLKGPVDPLGHVLPPHFE